MSAGVTSDPFQLERPGGGGGLLSAGREVAVILEEATGLAGICLDSGCLVVLALAEKDEGEISLSKNRISQMLVRKLDLPYQLNRR
jgi:hypothetical protein